MKIMGMEPRIETLKEKKLVGLHRRMSLADNKTSELWRSFMPRRKEISNRVSEDLLSMQVYDQTTGSSPFHPNTPFTKWAAAEVSEFSNIPEGMDTFVLGSGLYAVFLHKGAASSGPSIFRYIFETWLPQSAYQLDQRPHFEILGEKYKNDDPESEEEIWIPVRKR